MEYEELFIVEKGELGLIQQQPAHIQVDDPTPCRSPIYRYPEKAKDIIVSILKDLDFRGTGHHGEVHSCVVITDSTC